MFKKYVHNRFNPRNVQFIILQVYHTTFISHPQILYKVCTSLLTQKVALPLGLGGKKQQCFTILFWRWPFGQEDFPWRVFACKADQNSGGWSGSGCSTSSIHLWGIQHLSTKVLDQQFDLLSSSRSFHLASRKWSGHVATF